MPHTGLATDSTRRRRADIWSDEISWAPQRRRDAAEARADDPRLGRRLVAVADPPERDELGSAEPWRNELWREEWTSAIPEEWRLSGYESEDGGVAVLDRASSAAAAAAPRRTVKISGRGPERALAPTGGTARSRGAQRAHHRVGFQPDRMAMWAVLLGLLLILVAATI